MTKAHLEAASSRVCDLSFKYESGCSVFLQLRGHCHARSYSKRSHIGNEDLAAFSSWHFEYFMSCLPAISVLSNYSLRDETKVIMPNESTRRRASLFLERTKVSYLLQLWNYFSVFSDYEVLSLIA